MTSQSNRNVAVTLFALCLSSIALPASAQADNYPERPINYIVPYPPGGSADTLARTIAMGLSEQLGKPVVVDNRPGGNAMIGTQAAAKAKPDGYTLLHCVSSAFVVNPFLYDTKYDPIKDFQPISMLAAVPLMLATHTSIPASNVKEFVAYAKNNPGALTYATYGQGSLAHIAGEILQQVADVDMLHIPFKGSAPAVQETVAGRTTSVFTTIPVAMPHVHSGALKVLAVTSNEPVPDLDAPTFVSQGYDVVVDGWNAICAPKGIPEAVLNKLHTAVVATVKDPKVAKRLKDLGYLAKSSQSPQEFQQFIQSDMDNYGKVIRSANIKLN